MSIPSVPHFVLSLSPQELLNYCQTSQEALTVCSRPEYVRLYVRQYGLTPQQIPGETLQKKLVFLAGFNWEWVPGSTFPEKGQYLNQVMETAESLDPNLFQDANLGGHAFRINSQFSSALDRAVRTGNPHFVNYILNILIQRVGLPNLANYIHSFRDPLRFALITAQSVIPAQPWNQIANLLLRYYDARHDRLLLIMTGNDIRAGNLDAVKGLSLIFPPDEEGFWMAVENGHLDVAQFYRDALLSQGIDPVADYGNVFEAYRDAIHNNLRSTIDVLSTFVKPSQDVIQLAELLRNVQMAAYLRSKL